MSAPPDVPCSTCDRPGCEPPEDGGPAICDDCWPGDDADTFIGPCAHGRDPYDRCDTCAELTPGQAMLYGVAFRDGRRAGLLEAAELVEGLCGVEGGSDIADRIRALADEVKT